MKPLHKLGLLLSGSACLLASLTAAQQTEGAPSTEHGSPLSAKVEDLKQTALDLNRDLLALEEELLFPASTQITVFVSLDVEQEFRLDTLKLEIDKQLVATHLYSQHQNDSLLRGGIQRLYIGNLKPGEHELTATYTGVDADQQEHQQQVTLAVEKNQQPKMLELRIQNSTKNTQPEFALKEWQL